MVSRSLSRMFDRGSSFGPRSSFKPTAEMSGPKQPDVSSISMIGGLLGGESKPFTGFKYDEEFRNQTDPNGISNKDKISYLHSVADRGGRSLGFGSKPSPPGSEIYGVTIPDAYKDITYKKGVTDQELVDAADAIMAANPGSFSRVIQRPDISKLGGRLIGKSTSELSPPNSISPPPATIQPAQPSAGLQTAQPSATISQAGASNMADGTTETITTTGPSAFAQPYLEYGMKEAERQYQAGVPEYFPGQTYTEFAPQTEQALRAAEERALAGSPLVSGAQQFAQTAMGGGFGSPAMQYAQGLAGGVDLSEPMGMIRQTAQGSFLGGSPGLQAAIERATRPAQASAMSGLAQRGRLGSGLGSQAVAQTVGDIAANISYQDYNRERQNQIAAQQTLADMMRAQYGSALQGAGFLGDVYQQDYARRAGAAAAAPELAALDYADISRLASVGQARETQAQRAIDDALRRYQYEQTAPQEALSRYQNLVAGFPLGQTQTQITPYYEPSFGQQFLGGAAIAQSLFPKGYGSGEGEMMNRLYGALAGGLLGNL